MNPAVTSGIIITEVWDPGIKTLKQIYLYRTEICVSAFQ